MIDPYLEALYKERLELLNQQKALIRKTTNNWREIIIHPQAARTDPKFIKEFLQEVEELCSEQIDDINNTIDIVYGEIEISKRKAERQD